MPIKPENKSRYPEDWTHIAIRIKRRARWRCECTGECGHGDERCNVKNGTELLSRNGSPYRVVLTVAHLDHIPEHCDPSNLKAFCQSCHLRYDAPRKQAERLAKRNSGQLMLDVV